MVLPHWYTVKPPVSDHPKWQVLVVAYKRSGHRGYLFSHVASLFPGASTVRFKSTVMIWHQGGYTKCQVTGMIKGFFGLEMFDFGIFGGRKIGVFFCVA